MPCMFVAWPRMFVACLAVLLLVGCSGASAVPTATPEQLAGIPSAGCGGFRLKIINGLSQTVRVTIGPDWIDAVEAGATETIVGGLTQPMPPPLPWLVEIYDQSGRVTLFRQSMGGPVSQVVTLSAGHASQTTYSQQAEGC